SHIAGNAYIENRMDIPVHVYGAHIFHTKNETVWAYVNRFSAFNHYVNSPVADYHGEIYNLPFNMNTFSRLWGIRTPDEAKAKIAGQVSEANIQGEPANLEEQALSMAGRDIYEKLIKEYTEKQWGRPCTELPAFILKRVPLRFTYDNNYFDDPRQGIPVNGYTALAQALLDAKELSGEIEVRLSVEYRDFVETDENGLPARGEGEEFLLKSGDTASQIIYTGMIDEFFGRRLGTLEYRSLRFETDEYPDVDNYQGNAVVNYTTLDVPYTRSIEHKHFVFGRKDGGAGGQSADPSQMIHGTIVTREYPQDWTPDKEAYYPVNDDKNNALYKEYRALADKLPGVHFGGRLGTYRYYNMDQVILTALEDNKK
ncbi:MAG: UDP-galactopyranose mutase, partial [Lachnospiraceae bacterium]|nr:UDP-galactopyranose mutase [Lachnospiraceae bacterium]